LIISSRNANYVTIPAEKYKESFEQMPKAQIVRPGRKWDLWILRNVCNKIEEHFEFFTRTLRENFKESYLVISAI
jgi:hypothetical protein